VTVIEFSSEYILLLLYSIDVTVNCMTVIQFSSQYILLLLYCIGVTVNCMTVIQFSSEYTVIAVLYCCYSGIDSFMSIIKCTKCVQKAI